jgi:hypothetical protein
LMGSDKLRTVTYCAADTVVAATGDRHAHVAGLGLS